MVAVFQAVSSMFHVKRNADTCVRVPATASPSRSCTAEARRRIWRAEIGGASRPVNLRPEATGDARIAGATKKSPRGSAPDGRRIRRRACSRPHRFRWSKSTGAWRSLFSAPGSHHRSCSAKTAPDLGECAFGSAHRSQTVMRQLVAHRQWVNCEPIRVRRQCFT